MMSSPPECASSSFASSREARGWVDGKRKEGPSPVGLSLPSDLLRPKDFEPFGESAGAQTNGTLQFTFTLLIGIYIYI